MTRRVQLVLLCEDTQHEAFLRRFLTAMGWQTRWMRVERAPGGRGAGDRFVVQRFPRELAAQRSRRAEAALVAMIDGDHGGVSGRLEQLDRACRAAGIAGRSRHERAAVFVPTWSIETWLAYLDGQDVDEGQSGYPRLPRERDCRRHVEALRDMCGGQALREPSPPSLAAACDEYRVRLARDA